MTDDIDICVKAIHDSPIKFVFFYTGGGSYASHILTTVPGASSSILEVVCPYSRKSMVDILGPEPDQYVSTMTVKELAKQAYERAIYLNDSESEEYIYGVSCSCALATTYKKKGEHKFAVGICDGTKIHSFISIITKGRTRREEDELVGRTVLSFLGCITGITPTLNVPSEFHFPENSPETTPETTHN